jgi:hypothetical protein
MDLLYTAGKSELPKFRQFRERTRIFGHIRCEQAVHVRRGDGVRLHEDQWLQFHHVVALTAGKDT